ncbi:MAG: hypothetical protein FWF26_00430, partial [Treponema sp.]|nr:hypothetical protein [Treponema sp.]
MIKKLPIGILFFSLCLSLSAQTGLKIFVEENDGKLTIISSQGNTRELVIPDTINDKPVTAIGERAFTGK